MMTAKGEKLVVMLGAFAFFLCGVFALSLERGELRTLVLGCAVVGLLGLATRQTVKRLRGKDKS